MEVSMINNQSTSKHWHYLQRTSGHSSMYLRDKSASSYKHDIIRLFYIIQHPCHITRQAFCPSGKKQDVWMSQMNQASSLWIGFWNQYFGIIIAIYINKLKLRKCDLYYLVTSVIYTIKINKVNILSNLTKFRDKFHIIYYRDNFFRTLSITSRTGFAYRKIFE